MRSRLTEPTPIALRGSRGSEIDHLGLTASDRESPPESNKWAGIADGKESSDSEASENIEHVRQAVQELLDEFGAAIEKFAAPSLIKTLKAFAAGESLEESARAAVRRKYGLDDPICESFTDKQLKYFAKQFRD